jgi:RecA/RadA recombinase
MAVNFCQNVRLPESPPGARARSVRRLKNRLREKWPEAVCSLTNREELYFATGLTELDRIFPAGRGLPYGQLIEITGGLSSGKTSLLFRFLATALAGRRRIVYVDGNRAFFPDTALPPATDLSQLLVITSTAVDLKTDFRTAELLLRDHRVDIIVFDLIGRTTPLPLGLLHRLRLKTVRARGLVIFLTQASNVIPSSMASLRLEVERSEPSEANHFRVTVTKSRLCAEGIRLEVVL